MKKLCFALAFATLALFVSVNGVFAQCSPSATACVPSDPAMPACIDPDWADSANVDVAYSDTMYILIKKSATTSFGTAHIRRVKIQNIDSIPAGLTMTVYSGLLPGGTPVEVPASGVVDAMLTRTASDTIVTACAIISGTPTACTNISDSIVIKADIFVSLSGDTGDGVSAQTLGMPAIKFRYKLAVLDQNGLERQLATDTCNRPVARDRMLANSVNLKLFPNPSTSNSKFTFNLSSATDVMVKVNSLDGKTVYTTSVNCQAGYNSIEIPASQFVSGMYLVEFHAGDKFTTQKFVKN